MSSNSDPPVYRPRLSCELTQDQYNRLQAILPFGSQKVIYQALTEGIIELYETGGLEALSAISAKFISAQRVMEAGIQRVGRV